MSRAFPITSAAGRVVIAGSYTGNFDVPLEQQIAIRYGAIGLLTTPFAQR
jgi:2-keto-4-pentenoate hydratase